MLKVTLFSDGKGNKWEVSNDEIIVNNQTVETVNDAVDAYNQKR